MVDAAKVPSPIVLSDTDSDKSKRQKVAASTGYSAPGSSGPACEFSPSSHREPDVLNETLPVFHRVPVSRVPTRLVVRQHGVFLGCFLLSIFSLLLYRSLMHPFPTSMTWELAQDTANLGAA